MMWKTFLVALILIYESPCWRLNSNIDSLQTSGGGHGVLAHSVAADRPHHDFDDLYAGDFELDLDEASKQKLQQRLSDSARNKPDLSRSDMELIDFEVHPLSVLDDEYTNAKHSRSSKRHKFPKLAAKTFNFGRGTGYVATKPIRANNILFSVHMNQVMTLASAMNGRINVMLAANPDLPPSIVLALHILEERFLGPTSNFSTYIDTLPLVEDGMNSTMFYNDHELALLEGSQMHRLTVGRIQAVEKFFKALVGPLTSHAVEPPLFTNEEFTLENFRWAMGVVWSHAFPVGPDEQDVVIAPILDTIGICMDDKRCPPNRIELDTNAHELIVYAGKDYAVGEEILMDLSGRSSMLLLLNHGFTRPSPLPVVDLIEIAIVLDPQDPLADVKSFLMSSVNMSMNASYALRYEADSLSLDITASLKFKLLNGPEIAKYRDILATMKDTNTSPFVSLRNEYVYTRSIVMTCKNLLSQYRTTLQQDRERLKILTTSSVVNSSREVHILRILVLEKEILHHTVDLALRAWNDLILSDHADVILGK